MHQSVLFKHKWRSTLFLLFLFLLLNSSGFAQIEFDRYPDYDAVVTNFFSKYRLDEAKQYQVFKLEKRKKGWYVVIEDSRAYPEKKGRSMLFWDYNENKYLKLDFKPIRSDFEKEQNIKYHTRNYFHLFNSMPLYGYIGWDADVIRLLKDQNNLSDSMLYALARAYSSFASNLLNNYSGLSDPIIRYQLDPGPNALTEKQLETYRFHQHQSIAALKKLSKRNPEFKTFVGSIRTKYSNEIMTSFLNVRIYQNETEAAKELKPGLYSPFEIEHAKNTLGACKPNGILFTFGDNDTYPLLYVQAEMKYRQDVSIVNMSLLNTSRYINHFRKPILEAPALPLSIPANLTRPGHMTLALLSDSDTTKPLSEIISLIYAKLKMPGKSPQDYIHLPTQTFQMSAGDDTIQWKIDKNYIYRSHYTLLDIIFTNRFERPIHFTPYGPTMDYIGLEPYLKLRGLVYELSTTRHEPLSYTRGWVDSEFSYNYFMNKSNWSGVRSVNQFDQRNVINIRHIAHQIADTLIKKQDFDKAKTILDKCVSLFPNDAILYDLSMHNIMIDYYVIKDFESGNAIALTLHKNYTNQDREIRGRLQKLERLEAQVRMYDQESILPDE